MEKRIPLTDLREGHSGIVKSINAGRMATKRLMDLGLIPETRIKILRKSLFEGPVEIEVRGSKLVIGRGLAAKILVESI